MTLDEASDATSKGRAVPRPDQDGVSRTVLPRIVCSSVVRSVHQGESHGGVYLVDLADGDVEQLLDWSASNIDWSGRGGDRGLRGIAFHDGLAYLAASDEIFVYDRSFTLLGSFRNSYLRHCHEITVMGDMLYLASTGFDSVLEVDLKSHVFTRGWCLRYSRVWRLRRTLNLRSAPTLSRFDPMSSGGPKHGDTSHVNNVVVEGGAIYASGTRLPALYRLDGPRLQRYARAPYGTHNTMPFRDGILFNHTRTDRIAYADRSGRVRRSVAIPTYTSDMLEHAALTEDLARASFGRGLTVLDDQTIVGGSSPATITAYDIDEGRTLRSVNITMDIRNAIHGLEVWPWDEP